MKAAFFSPKDQDIVAVIIFKARDIHVFLFATQHFLLVTCGFIGSILASEQVKKVSSGRHTAAKSCRW